MEALIIAYAVLVVILILWCYVGNKCATSDREICHDELKQKCEAIHYLTQ